LARFIRAHVEYGKEGKEFLESPVSRARLQPTPPEYQDGNSFVNRKS
jgi:hypothetical protein